MKQAPDPGGVVVGGDAQARAEGIGDEHALGVVGNFRVCHADNMLHVWFSSAFARVFRRQSVGRSEVGG